MQDVPLKVTPETDPGKPSTELTGSLFFLLSGLAALGTLATNIILPAFPAMGADIGVSAKDLGATLSSFFVAFAVGQLFVGPLSDRYGRQKLVIGGLATLIVGSAVCAAATTLPQLIGGRVIQAIGACATSVLSRAIARDLFDGDGLTRTLSLIMVAMAAAPGFSPLLGGVVASTLGWRATFLAVGALGLCLIFFYHTKLGETHAVENRSALSIRDVLIGYKRLIVDRRFMAPAISVSLVISSLFAFFGLAPAILMVGFHLTSLELGWFFASTPFVVFGAGLLTPRLARRWGAPRVALAGICIALSGGLALLVGYEDLYYFYGALTVFLTGMGLVNPLGTALALQPFGKQAGAASALFGFFQMGFAAIVTGLGSVLSFPAYTSFGIILTVSLTISLFVFLTSMRAR